LLGVSEPKVLSSHKVAKIEQGRYRNPLGSD